MFQIGLQARRNRDPVPELRHRDVLRVRQSAGRRAKKMVCGSIIGLRLSVGILMQHAFPDRQPDDFQIEENGPMLDIVEVILQALFQ